MDEQPPRKIIDIPPEIERDYSTPQQYKTQLGNTQQTTPCAMPYTVLWKNGPMKGMPLTLYCAEPLCLRAPGEEPGPCTGPRFVPHLQQYTRPDPLDPLRRQRAVPQPAEIIAGVRRAGEKATAITKVRDDRSDREIARHVGLTWSRMKKAILGGGSWGT